MDVLKNKNGLAWILMVSAGTLHVIDEAIHGFLSVYNPLVESVRESLGFFPMPTFSTGPWLAGLIGAIIISFAVTPVVNRGRRVVRIVFTALGILMAFNALGHMLGSVYFGYLLPGFWSSPLLLVTAVYVVKRGVSRTGWVR